LCWTCYYTPGVRELYPATNKYARRGAGVGVRRVKPALEPTDARPGSPEKILVLARRLELGQELWHPGDATFAGPRVLGQAG
jgi:hypothetical protein